MYEINKESLIEFIYIIVNYQKIKSFRKYNYPLSP